MDNHLIYVITLAIAIAVMPIVVSDSNFPSGLQNITNSREFHAFKDPSETIVEGPPMSYCIYKMGVMISCDE
jgi:hypothetical protein